MMHPRSFRAMSWTSLALLTVVLTWSGHPAWGQDASAARKPDKEKSTVADKAEAPAPAEKPKFRGRLPNYYTRVVTEKQRQEIYAMQERYAARIDALRNELAALIEKRDEEVASVLSPEQAKEVERIAAEAKAERERKAKEKATAEKSSD